MSMHDGKIAAHLEAKIEVSDGLAIFRFALEHEFRFEPGQYATLWLTHGGETLARPYSIASSPSETHTLEFYINLVREGRLTPSLWQPDVIEGLQSRSPNTKAAITGPQGRFVFDCADPRDFVCVSSGTGLAPFVSVVRKLNEEFLASPKHFRPRTIYLIHGVSYPSHLGYREELEKLAAESANEPRRKLALIYLPTISRPFMDSSWKGLKGRAETLLDNSRIPREDPLNLENAIKGMLRIVVRPETHAVYVCGHPGTVENIVDALARRGFRVDSDVKREKYYP
jgi:ferredoxin/flavodoxin---NADP+ reductase